MIGALGVSINMDFALAQIVEGSSSKSLWSISFLLVQIDPNSQLFFTTRCFGTLNSFNSLSNNFNVLLEYNKFNGLLSVKS